MELKNPGQCLAEKLSVALCGLLSQCNCLGKWISEQQCDLFRVRQALGGVRSTLFHTGG